MHSIYEIGVPSSTNAGIYEAFLFVANKTLFFPLFVVGSQNSAVSPENQMSCVLHYSNQLYLCVSVRSTRELSNTLLSVRASPEKGMGFRDCSPGALNSWEVDLEMTFVKHFAPTGILPGPDSILSS